jgi:hypothetical protein
LIHACCFLDALRAPRQLVITLAAVLGVVGMMIGSAAPAHADGFYQVQARPSLNVHNGPYTTNPPVIPSPLPFGTGVHVWCQYPYGSSVNGSTFWDFLGFDRSGVQHWVTDYYVSTLVYDGFSPGQPNCANGLNPFWTY